MRARRWPRCWPGWSRPRKAGQGAVSGVPLGCLAKVLRAFAEKEAAPGARRGAAAAVPGLVDQLTARELDVLRLLAAGAPNPRIAEQLVVSLDTVKKHVSHLLGKLGAANRTEAVTRARRARPDPLALAPQTVPAPSCPEGGPGGTAVLRRLGKIAPAYAPSGDARQRRRLVLSLEESSYDDGRPPAEPGRTWRVIEEIAVKRIRIDRPRARRERPWREVLPADPRDPDVVRPKRSSAPPIRVRR